MPSVNPSVADIEAVASTAEPILRNLRITATYAQLSGAFAGTLSYTIARTAGGSRAKIRGVGQTTKLGFLPASMVEGPARSALREDLERLKQIIEK
jgi:hypothetical protein